MIEASIAGGVAVVTGGYAVIQAIHNRVNKVDRRLDKIELNLARNYIPRDEFVTIQSKIEQHMVRIEEKLDRMLERS